VCLSVFPQENRSRRAEPTETQNKPPDTLDVIKVDSNLVSVPVIVSDRQGRYVPDLKQQSFKLFDNGVEQTITYFDAAEEPLNIALMLDTSRSTEGVLDDIKQAAKNFLKQLRPQDRAMIVSFDYEVHHLSHCESSKSHHAVLSPEQSGRNPTSQPSGSKTVPAPCVGGLTNDRRTLERAIDSATVGKFAGTSLNDAVMEVAGKDFKNINGRKAIILLSDGKDFGSMITADTLLEAEAESDTMVYSIFYASDFGGFGGWGGRGPGVIWGRRSRPGPRPEGSRRRERSERGAEFLRELSEVTSGRFYQSELTNLDQTFALIAEELRHQYRLGFYPGEIKKDGTVHDLRVKVDAQDVAVRARKQYRAALHQE
jgi:VWFA-related protein